MGDRRIRRAAAAGFTLIELLTVITILGIMAGILGYALRGRGTDSFGLQAAQQTVASMLTLARSQAAVSGENAAFFVNTHAANTDRYFRYVVAAIWDPAVSEWRALGEGVTLPAGCYVVPRDGPPADAIEDGAEWGGSQPVKSTALQQDVADQSLFVGDEETWVGTQFTPRGTTSQQGDIVVATGRPNPPGATEPFSWTNPDNVRGISISSYGQLTYLNNRSDL